MIFFVHMFGLNFLGAVNASGLHDDEEVYLTKNGKEIFKAQYQHCSSDITVHGEVISKENESFSLIKCLICKKMDRFWFR